MYSLSGWVRTCLYQTACKIAVGIRPERLSYEYIKESEECVINLTTRDMVNNITDYCGVVSGKREDKISKLDRLNYGVAINTPSLRNFSSCIRV